MSELTQAEREQMERERYDLWKQGEIIRLRHLRDHPASYVTTRAYWLREYAGRAMHGLVASPKLNLSSTDAEMATLSVKLATVLLSEIERHEAGEGK